MKQTFTINTEKNRIEFHDARFYLSDSGMYIPSVTTILDAFPKGPEYYAWLKKYGEDADTIRDEAGKRGSIVHDLTEKYDEGEEINFLNDYGHPKYKMLEWAMFERYVEFTDLHKPKVDMIEVHMIDEQLGFAGTIDRVINLNGKSMLMDIKTSSAVHQSYWLQLSAYFELLKCNSVFVDQVGILWLNAKTRTTGKGDAIQGKGWQLLVKDAKEVARDYALFQSTYALWKELNADVKPRNLSYTLTYKK
jgi:hypothetical protein